MRRLLVVLAFACGPHPVRPTEATPVAPVAARHPHRVESPFGTRDDPYYWLRDDTRKDPAVLAYLTAENAYARAMLEPARAIEDTLVREVRARIDEEERAVPELDDGYWYYARYERGKQHPVYARRKGTIDAPEEVILDGNRLAGADTFFSIGDYAVSRDGRLLAWTEDRVGRNQFTLHVKNLATGEVLADTADKIAPSVAWANDNRTVFYVGKDPTTLREDRVVRHVVGGRDTLVYKEDDAAFYVDVAATKSHRYIAIELSATAETETRLVDADHPDAAPRVFLPRTDDRYYEIDHLGDRFVMRTNDGAANYQVVEIPAGKQADRRAWKTLVPERADVFVEDLAVYDGFIAVGVRAHGLQRVEVVPANRPAFMIDAPEPTYAMTLVDTADSHATRVRYAYESLTTPHSVYEVDPATGARTLLQREQVPTYDSAQYATEYVHATATDGTQVPISLVYKKTTRRDGTAPLLVTGYGAYGVSSEPSFDRERVSLLDRGWVIAIAHVRGGEELGEAWYDAGRLLAKRNTFTDFIAVTEYLVGNKYAARDRVFAEGASAGGLLVTAVANMRPDLYRGMVVWVPFVDVVTTMMDPSIPLVTNEYDEWGDPSDKTAYEYMLGYSPYDNIRAQAYPALYVRSGLWDGLVAYYEPAKWVAKLRATRTDHHLLVFETDMHAGHQGVTGRYNQIREEARAYAFCLYVLGAR